MTYETTEQCLKCGRDFIPEENEKSLCPDCHPDSDQYEYALVPARLIKPKS